MAIKWFDNTTTYPTITLAKYGVTFNIGCLPYLNKGKSLVFGCDPEQNKVHIKILTDGKSTGFMVPEINDETRTIRVSCKEFVQYLQVRCGVNLEKAKKYYADFNEIENEFVIDLDTPIPGRKQTK